MPLNNNGLVHLANALQDVFLYGQLHSGLAGVTGVDNIATAGRVAVNWDVPDSDGKFRLISEIAFTGGVPDATVYSVTMWDDETAGLFYGEFVLTGDNAFNGAGEYEVTALDFTGTSNDNI